MPEYTGKDMVISWVYSGGTISLTDDYRVFSWTPSIEKFNTRASSEANEAYITGAKDFTASYSGLAQSAGTALEDAFSIGTSGTLTVQPEGTATGKRKFTFPCFTVSEPVQQYQYNALVETKIDWQGNGAWTKTTN
jgi:hypothetical protein